MPCHNLLKVVFPLFLSSSIFPSHVFPPPTVRFIAFPILKVLLTSPCSFSHCSIFFLPFISKLTDSVILWSQVRFSSIKDASFPLHSASDILNVQGLLIKKLRKIFHSWICPPYTFVEVVLVFFLKNVLPLTSCYSGVPWSSHSLQQTCQNHVLAFP